MSGGLHDREVSRLLAFVVSGLVFALEGVVEVCSDHGGLNLDACEVFAYRREGFEDERGGVGHVRLLSVAANRACMAG